MADINIIQLASTRATAAGEMSLEEAAQWTAQYNAGYRDGRAHAISDRVRADWLVTIPADLPYETGAAWVKRNLPLAWRIAYTRAVTSHRARISGAA